MHTDHVDHDNSEAIVAAAQARSVPVISAKQALTWLDGREASSFRGLAWDAGIARVLDPGVGVRARSPGDAPDALGLTGR